MGKYLIPFGMLFYVFFSSSSMPAADNVSVEIEGYSKNEGSRVWIKVFVEKGFLKEPLIEKSVLVGTQKVIFSFSLPKGSYAISTYQDINGNNKLDRHFYGAPKEPYGFSNNIKPSFGPPDYSDCKFSVDEAGKSLFIKLLK